MPPGPPKLRYSVVPPPLDRGRGPPCTLGGGHPPRVPPRLLLRLGLPCEGPRYRAARAQLARAGVTPGVCYNLHGVLLLGPTSSRPMYACRGGPLSLLPAGLPLMGSWRRECPSSLGTPGSPTAGIRLWAPVAPGRLGPLPPGSHRRLKSSHPLSSAHASSRRHWRGGEPFWEYPWGANGGPAEVADPPFLEKVPGRKGATILAGVSQGERRPSCPPRTHGTPLPPAPSGPPPLSPQPGQFQGASPSPSGRGAFGCPHPGGRQVRAGAPGRR